MEPFDVDAVYHKGASHTPDIEEDVMASDIKQILNEHIPSSCRADYRCFIEGVSLPKNKRERLMEQIKEILSKHWGKNENG